MVAHFSGNQAHLLILPQSMKLYSDKKVGCEGEHLVKLERVSPVPCIGSQILLSVSVEGRWCDSRKEKICNGVPRPMGPLESYRDPHLKDQRGQRMS